MPSEACRRLTGERLPFLTAGGDLSIPFDSPERYHWWKRVERSIGRRNPRSK